MKTLVALLAVGGATSLVAGCAAASHADVRAGRAGAAMAPVSTACGGDVVGTWNVVSSNVHVDGWQVGDHCAAKASGVELAVKGTVTFRPDKTYERTSSMAGRLVLDVPSSCIGPGLDCSNMQQAFASDAFASARCTPANDGCTCTAELKGAPEQEAGTYATTPAGLLRETSADDSTPDESDYCVEGQTLTEWPHKSSNDGLTGSIVLMKQ
jgi:hypothetical protein